MKTHTRYYSEDHSHNKSKIKRLAHISPKSLDNSSPNPEYLSILEGLQKLCDSYDQLPTIQFEEEDEYEDSSDLPQVQPRKAKPDSKLNFIINQLKIRIKNYPRAQAAYPSSNRFKVVSGTEEKVGPGTYKTLANPKLETYEFSNIPRLFTPIAHTMHTIESLYKNRKEVLEDTLIRKNKFLAFNSQAVQEEIKGKKQKQKRKEVKNKIKRVRLESIDHFIKENKLTEKIRKFEWRMNKEEVAQVQQTWASLLSIFGLLSVLHLRTEVKRILRIRWGKVLRRFLFICRSIGKFMINLKKIRSKNVKSSIKYLSTPTINTIKASIQSSKGIIRSLIDKYRDMPIIISLMAKWAKSIKMLQVNWRIAKKVLKARKLALGLLWDKLSDEMLKAKMMEKIHRSSTIDRSYLFPSEIKEMFIKKFMKTILTSYSKEKKDYTHLQNLIQNSSDLPPVQIHKKPILLLYSHKGKLQNFIERASAFRFKQEKKQREIRYNITSTQFTRSLTKSLNK